MDDRLINGFRNRYQYCFHKECKYKNNFRCCYVARGIIPFDLKNCNVGFVSLELRNAIFPINLYKEKYYNLEKSV